MSRADVDAALQERLSDAQVTWTPIDQRTKWELLKKWHEVFPKPFPSMAPYVRGAKAEQEYFRRPGGRFYLVSQAEGPSYECSAATLPDLSGCIGTFFVFDPEFSWTMIFVREDEDEDAFCQFTSRPLERGAL